MPGNICATSRHTERLSTPGTTPAAYGGNRRVGAERDVYARCSRRSKSLDCRIVAVVCNNAAWVPSACYASVSGSARADDAWWGQRARVLWHRAGRCKRTQLGSAAARELDVDRIAVLAAGGGEERSAGARSAHTQCRRDAGKSQFSVAIYLSPVVRSRR